MRLFLFSLVVLCATLTKAQEDPIVLTINQEEVKVSDFKYIYNKNNRKADDAYSKESLDEYMDLFVKFKLKVLEAERLGLDTVPEFIKELEGYRKQLAKPYLTEEGFLDKMIQEAYERMKFEVRASHILVKVGLEDEPADTLKAYNKALELLKKVKDGADFGEIAEKHSDDPSAKRPEGSPGHHGDLGYFTALSLVYPFETAAYNAEVGSVVGPVRTRFGYHLIKVVDRRESLGKVKVAHIMVQAAAGISKEDSLAAKRKIDEIYLNAKKPDSNWDQLCSQFSDDVKTKNKGGELFAFGMNGKLGVPAFEKAAFGLENIGDISTPVNSPYGWHVIKLLEKLPIGSFEELQKDLKRKVSRDSRAQLDKKVLYARLKKENDFKEVSKSKVKAFAFADSSILTANWETPEKASKIGKKPLFTINGEKFPVSDFFAYVENNQKSKSGISPNYAMTLLYDKYVNETVYRYEEENLVEKYYDYKMLTKEYRDGILLFKLMEDMVWNKAAKDTAGLRAFYESNDEKFYWEERLNAVIYDLGDKSRLDELKKDVEAGLSEIELKNKYNKESSLTLNVKSDKFEKGENDIIDLIKWKVGSEVINKDDRTYYVVVKELLPKTKRTLQDSKGIIISEYQNQLEKEWIAELKSQYSIKIHEDVLQSMVK